jgi:hypothetical protein
MTDLVIFIKNGPTVWAEVKNKKGTLTSHQVAFQNDLLDMGHIHQVWRSLQDAVCGLVELGVEL